MTHIWILLVIAFFASLAYLDFSVHSLAYGYGLTFSEAWAVPYWRALELTVLIFAALLGWQHYRDAKDIRGSLLRVLTVYTLYSGGLIDWFFFLYQGGFPAGQWTWMPQYKWFGSWNTTHQACWSVVHLASLITLRLTNKWCQFLLCVSCRLYTWIKKHG